MSTRPEVLSIEVLLAHADWVRALAGRLVADPARADDIAQDTWVAAMEAPPRDTRNIKGWLSAIVRNTAREVGRGEQRRVDRERAVSRSEAGVPSSAELVQRANLQREIAAHVVALDEPYRTVVLLRWYEGLPPREIAQRLGRPVDTVTTQLARAHAQLRTQLDRDHGDRSTWSALLVGLARPHPIAATAGGGIIGGALLAAGWKIAIGSVALLVLALALWRKTDSLHVDEATRATDVPDVLVHTDGSAVSGLSPDTNTATERTSVAVAVSPTSAAAPGEAGLVQIETRGRVVDERGLPVAGLHLRVADLNLPRSGAAGIHDSKGRMLVTPGEIDSMRANPESIDAFVSTRPQPGLREAILGSGLHADATTDADGRYAVVVPGLADNWVEVESADPAWMLFTNAYEKPSRDVVYIAAPVIVLAGEVVSADGSPIKGADVTMGIYLENLRELTIDLAERSTGGIRAEMSEEGKFRFERMPRVSGWSFTVSCPGWEVSTRRIPKDSDEHMRIVLKRARPTPKLSGIVLDSEGQPAGYAKVLFGYASAQANGDGRFVLTPREWHEDSDLVAVKTDAIAAVVPDFGREIKASQGDVTGLVLRLGPTPLTIDGHVLSAKGEPCAGWEVDVYDGTPAGLEGMAVENLSAGRERFEPGPRTSKSGAFSVDGLGSRAYRIRALSPDKKLMVLSDPVVPGSGDLVLRVPPDAVRARVAGRVISRKGEPIVGARVMVECRTSENKQGWSFGLQGGGVETDALGRFELLDVPRYHASLVVSVGKNREKPLVLAPDAPAESLEIVVSRLARFRVELLATDRADAFEVVDAHGQKLAILIHESFDLRTLSRVERDEDGFPPCEVDEEAVEIVFLRGSNEVRRVPVALKVGETNVIRL